MLPEPDYTQIKSLEERLLKPEVRTSLDALIRLLADEFVEFCSSGRIANKQQVIKGLLRQSARHFSISDFRTRVLTPDVVLATYRVTCKIDATDTATESLRSSIWKFQDGRWQMVFHQGTSTE